MRVWWVTRVIQAIGETFSRSICAGLDRKNTFIKKARAILELLGKLATGKMRCTRWTRFFVWQQALGEGLVRRTKILLVPSKGVSDWRAVTRTGNLGTCAKEDVLEPVSSKNREGGGGGISNRTCTMYCILHALTCRPSLLFFFSHSQGRCLSAKCKLKPA